MNRNDAIQSIRDVCRLKHYALTTEETYCHWVNRYCLWLAKNHASVADTPSARIAGFLTDLAKSDVAASTQNQALSAILFFYRAVLNIEPGNVNALRAKRPAHIRHAPPIADVRKLLAAVENSPAYPFRTICALIYGSGLRVSEPLAIRIRDLDLANRRVVIREAKHGKDRLVPVPEVLIEPLNRQIAAARVVWQRAVSQGVQAKLPHQLGTKYKNAGFEWSWWWLFPMEKSCCDPRTSERVWWHCLPTGVQKALGKAARKTGLGGSISPHHLRHAWATHAHDAGASVRDLQEILGHKSLETTMIYVHPEIERVSSPLQALGIAI
jgi:site-specific recombinase XerD